MPLNIPRLVVAGTSSGAGKTTVTLGLIQALRQKGFRVAAFKCGPDYLDPTYHARVGERPCHNLDGWMMGREAVLATFVRACRDADIAVIEGVMGLFDGLSPTSQAGSTAEIAKWLGAPVLLVLDAGGMAASIAPIVRGMAEFDAELRIAGVLANFVGSEGHAAILKSALGNHTRAMLVGGLPDSPEQSFPERHLGLYGADDARVSGDALRYWGELCASRLDMDLIVKIARDVPPVEFAEEGIDFFPGERRCRIGVALDPAFHFYYADNLRRLEREGAELCFFSPLRDRLLPVVDGLYIGGGYPELYARELAGNTSLAGEIRRHALDGKPIYAECGGLMYLSEQLTTLQGETFPMVGLIPGQVRMGEKLKALGYVEVATQRETILGAPGIRFRGHQFRYSELTLNPDAPVELCYQMRRGRDPAETTAEGYSLRKVLASYVHAHWASSPQAARGFVDSCAKHLS